MGRRAQGSIRCGRSRKFFEATKFGFGCDWGGLVVHQLPGSHGWAMWAKRLVGRCVRDRLYGRGASPVGVGAEDGKVEVTTLGVAGPD